MKMLYQPENFVIQQHLLHDKIFISKKNVENSSGNIYPVELELKKKSD